ncbi:MAG: protease HtpX [Candidatus Competibacteraceae bacterium]|nr:protease HtpX [Candidatus Competibacteraceae bacterium]
MRRIFLFLLTNLAVMLVLGVVLNIVMTAFGIPRDSYAGLLVIALIFGMGGAVISLLMSKSMAKRATGAQVLSQPTTATERWLVETVQRQAQAAGIGMPEVAIYHAPEINAFATGANRNNALVAVSTGLLNSMNQDEAEAVLGHEVSHIANGDMVTLTLIQGVVNTFVIFLARVIANIISSSMRGSNQEGGGLGFMAYIAIVFVLEAVFGILASMIVAWFSRQREFRADAGGASLAGRQKMIAALERLQQQSQPSHLPDQMAAFGISGKGSGLMALFASHPPLAQRIEALRQAN